MEPQGTLSPVLDTAPSAALDAAHLADQARQFAIASRAPATLAAYASDFRHFTEWTEVRGFSALPATPETVALYVTDLAATFKASTITRRIAAISVAHQHHGFDSPTRDGAVRSVLTGVRRTLGTAPRQAAPATIGDLRRWVARLGDRPIDLRDRAILLLGFAGAFRRSELVSLDVADLQDRPEGLLVRLRRSKTDQEGRGSDKPIPFGTDDTCPVQAVRAWIAAAGIEEKPIFRPVDRHGRVAAARLSGHAVAGIVKRAAERAGADPSDLSGHSLRAGFCTSAAAAGASERAIARQTGHAPGSTVLRGYIRLGNAFSDNAVNLVGL